jgi:citrate lyase subunit beta / citryl-CoA lyase
MTIRPRRSVLYMPGANERAMEKAKALPADSLILDLEDSVAPEVKVAARAAVCAAVKAGGYGRRELVIRPNAIETPWGMEDLRAAASVAPDAILVPKVSLPGDILTVAKVLADIGAPDKTRLWAMMETPRSILNVREIAALGADPESRLVCLVMGTNDLLKESRARALHNRIAVVPWLAMSLVAARAYGLDILDGVYNDYRDDAGFCAECEHGRILGMDGKTLIHPSQVGPCNEIFSPTEEEVAWARTIIAAFAEPENAHKGVITVQGKMVERLHLVQAKRTVAIAEAIATMRKSEEEWF